MKAELVHLLLSDSCSRGSYERVQKLLNENPGLDITIDNAKYFGIAAAQNFPKLLEVLIDYYEKNQLKTAKTPQEYAEAEEILLKTLGDIKNLSGAIKSGEIQAIIGRYLVNEEDDELESAEEAAEVEGEGVENNTDREDEFVEFDYASDDNDAKETSMASAHDSARYPRLTAESLAILSRTASMSTDGGNSTQGSTKEMPEPETHEMPQAMIEIEVIGSTNDSGF